MIQSKMDINNMRVIDQSGNSMLLGYYENEGDGHLVINDVDVRMEDFNSYIKSIRASAHADTQDVDEGENAGENADYDMIRRLANAAVYSSAFTTFVILSISMWAFQLAKSINDLSCA